MDGAKKRWMRIDRCPLTSPVQGEKQKKTVETLPFIQCRGRGRGRGGEGREDGGGGEGMISKLGKEG